NRADLLQRQGLYPPPPGASPILGLECAGEVVEVGPEARGFRPGQRVMALLPGGGYAEEAVVHHGSALPVPETMSDEEAGAFPEVFLTAFSNLFMPGLGALAPGEAALVHGGGGGVGPAAIPDRPRPAARRGGRGASPDAVERALREDRAARQLDERRAGMAGETDYLARGLEVAAKLWGARVGGQELPAQKLAPEFFGLAAQFVFGMFWSRPNLDLRSRSLCTVAQLAALGRTEELKLHLAGALNL